MTNIPRIGDSVELIYAQNVYDLEVGKIYKIREVSISGNNILILVNESETAYNLKRFKHGIKFIRKEKLNKIFNK